MSGRTEGRAIPVFTCHRQYAGHSCHRERGHRGQHECQCRTAYTNAPTHYVPHHDLVTIEWPESRAA